MNLQDLMTQAIALAIGGVVTVSAGYYLLKNDIRTYLDLKAMGAKDKEGLLSLRLQAHERLILFVERINPSNLFLRLHQQGLTAKELQSHILTEIRTEYQHNVSQQLYIGAETWQMVRKLKDDTLMMINNAKQSLPEEASSVDLSKLVLQHLTGISENPYDLTQLLIKKDIHQLF